MVFQDPYSSLDPRMTVGDIVGRAAAAARARARRSSTARVAELLDQVGLRAEVRDRYPHELSGGQRQRVGHRPRAESSKPRLLVADEPMSALDVSVQAAVLNLLADLQRDHGLRVPVHHPRPVDRRVPRRPGRRHVPRPDRRDRAARGRSSPHPQHPYTQALLSAAPVPDPVEQRARQRVVLERRPARRRLDPPSGCRFHTRCPLVATHSVARGCGDGGARNCAATNGHLVACLTSWTEGRT